jgi:hypothetical protein
MAAENQHDGLAVERVWLPHIQLKCLALILAAELGAKCVRERTSDGVVYTPLAGLISPQREKEFHRAPRADSAIFEALLQVLIPPLTPADKEVGNASGQTALSASGGLREG